MKRYAAIPGWAQLALLPLSLLSASGQSVVINEFMYHPLQPQAAPEPVGEEFIEIYNIGAANVNLAGWRFNKGVTFTFPNVDLAPGAYLVVSPDTNVFQAKYPGVNNVIGNWTGTLANRTGASESKDASGNVVDPVAYASEGDWAGRQRGPNDLGHRGWKWFSPADGLGKSIERRNAALRVDSGQNWAPSGPAGGTPGRVNSVA